MTGKTYVVLAPWIGERGETHTALLDSMIEDSRLRPATLWLLVTLVARFESKAIPLDEILSKYKFNEAKARRLLKNAETCGYCTIHEGGK